MDENRLIFSNKDLKILFVPLVIEQGLNFLVGLADSLMVAQVGEAAVSGVSLVDNFMGLIINVAAAIATGGIVIASQYLGRKWKPQAEHAVNQLAKFMLFAGIALMLISYLIKPLILDHLFGAIDRDVWNAANIYYIIVVASIPFICMYNCGAALFRALGNSNVSMKTMVAMNSLNVAGNAILVFGFHMGVAGVAIPTLISRIGAAVIILILARRKKNELTIRGYMKERFDFSMIRRVLGIGLPYGLENGLFSLGRLIVLSIVALYGTDQIAANAVAGSITLMLILPGTGINLGLSVVISRCVGAKDYEQAEYYKKKISRTIHYGFLISSAVVIAMMPLLMKAYSLSETATRLTWFIIIMHAVLMNLTWIPAWTMPVVIRSAGDAKFPMVVSIVSMLFVRIMMAYLLAEVFHLEMLGTWYAMYLDWFVRGILLGHRYRSGRWKTFDALK